MIFILLFLTFFKIGLFGFGGGYAMISMIQGEVVEQHQWITSAEFTDIVAISQMTPGPIGINSATYVGYTAVANAGYSSTTAIIGSIIATLAVILPSFILMLTISHMLIKHKNHPIITSIFRGLRPAIVGLIASAALLMMNSENFGSWNESHKQFILSILLFLATFIGNRFFRISPITLILLCGIIGGIWM